MASEPGMSDRHFCRTMFPQFFGDNDDTPDLSDPRPYLQRLPPWDISDADACAAKQNYINFCLNIRRGTPVKDGERRSCDELLDTVRREDERVRSESNPGFIHIWNDKAEYLPSTKKYERMERTIIGDLLLGELNPNKWNHVRTISPAVAQGFAILAVVEDVSKGGNKLADNLVLHGLLSYSATKEHEYLKYFLPQGSLLTIKQPYLTLQDGLWSLIRSDHAGDVMIRRPLGQWTFTPSIKVEPNESDVAELLEATGNQLMKQGRSHAAEVVFSEAIRATKVSHTESLSCSILLSHAAASLEIGNLDQAVTDCDKLLEKNRKNATAIYVKAKACYALRDFSKANAAIQECLEIREPCPEAGELLARIHERIEEQIHGVYDFAKMSKDAKCLRHPELDHASWMGPVEIRRSKEPNMGRGLVATRDIDTGELMLCEKALMMHFDDESVHHVNVQPPGATAGAAGSLIHSLTHLFHHNPTLRREFGKICCDDCRENRTHLHDEKRLLNYPIINQRIRSLWFQDVGASLEERMKSKEDMDAWLAQGLKGLDNLNRSIWVMASYINHSCVSNAFRCFVGDMMCVRAHRPIAKDEEIFFSYCDSSHEVESRRDALMEQSFVCKCELCESQSIGDPKIHQIRKQLMESFVSLFQRAFEDKSFSTAQKAIEVLGYVSATYEKGSLQPELAHGVVLIEDLLQHLARARAAKSVLSGRPTSDSLREALERSTGADLTGWRKFKPKFLCPYSRRLLVKAMQRLKEEGKEREARRVKRLFARHQIFYDGSEPDPKQLEWLIGKYKETPEYEFIEKETASKMVQMFYGS